MRDEKRNGNETQYDERNTSARRGRGSDTVCVGKQTRGSQQGARAIGRAVMRETEKAIDRWLRRKTGVLSSTDRLVLYI